MTKTASIDGTKIDKQAYLDNQKEQVKRFEVVLSEVSSIEDKNIWSNFTAVALFNLIKEQKAFVAHIKKNGHKFAKSDTEIQILEQFVKQSKDKFGKEYDRWFKEIVEGN